jgi:hypothetical protein
MVRWIDGGLKDCLLQSKKQIIFLLTNLEPRQKVITGTTLLVQTATKLHGFYQKQML